VAAIFWLSLTPRPPTIDIEQGDKLGHFGAYGLLMLLFCQVYDQRRTRLAYASGFIAMGIAIEFLQRMTGYRTFDVLDMAANATGVILGWAAAALLDRFLRASG
jgi:VanZ family protein